jgi:dTDP-4-dehydrorhamnose 3,5-epimerase
MLVEPTRIAGVLIIHPEVHRDPRGFFSEAFNFTEFAKKNLTFRVDQTNVSMSTQAGTVRGMHWQDSPFGQIKLVRCIQGEALDVVVDVRPESPTYGDYILVSLKADELVSVYIPHGCAHGWQALQDFSKIEYLVSGPWNKEAERGLRPDDPELGIVWPKPPVNLNPRDLAWLAFKRP